MKNFEDNKDWQNIAEQVCKGLGLVEKDYSGIDRLVMTGKYFLFSERYGRLSLFAKHQENYLDFNPSTSRATIEIVGGMRDNDALKIARTLNVFIKNTTSDADFYESKFKVISTPDSLYVSFLDGFIDEEDVAKTLGRYRLLGEGYLKQSFLNTMIDIACQGGLHKYFSICSNGKKEYLTMDYVEECGDDEGNRPEFICTGLSHETDEIFAGILKDLNSGALLKMY